MTALRRVFNPFDWHLRHYKGAAPAGAAPAAGGGNAGAQTLAGRSKSHIYGSTSGAAAGSGGDEVRQLFALLEADDRVFYAQRCLPLPNAWHVAWSAHAQDQAYIDYRYLCHPLLRAQVRLRVPEISVAMEAHEFEILQDVASHLAMEQVQLRKSICLTAERLLCLRADHLLEPSAWHAAGWTGSRVFSSRPQRTTYQATCDGAGAQPQNDSSVAAGAQAPQLTPPPALPPKP